MSQFERPRVYPGGYGLDSEGPLVHPVDTDLWWKPLTAPGTDPSINGPVGPDRFDDDPFLDYPLPVIVAKFNLDTFELYFPCDQLDGLNLMDLRSTLWGFGGAWVARSLAIQAWENFEAYGSLEGLDGLGTCYQGFGGLWVARNRPFGLYGWDDFESYVPNDDVNGLNNGAGLGPMVGRGLGVPVTAYDTFETYAAWSSIDTQNAGIGFTDAWVNEGSGDPYMQPRVCGGLSDQRLSLGSGFEVRRKMPWLDSWNKVRVAIRMQWREDVNDLWEFPRLVVGVSSSTGDPFTSGTTGNFIGAEVTGWLWAYEWSLLDPPWYGSATLRAVRKIGAVETYGAVDLTATNDFVVNFGPNASVGVARACRSVVFIDIVKGSPNYTVYCPLFPSGSAGATVTDFSEAGMRFYEALEVLITPILGHEVQSGVAQNFTVDEPGDGVLDMLDIALLDSEPMFDFKFEISDVSVTKFS